MKLYQRKLHKSKYTAGRAKGASEMVYRMEEAEKEISFVEQVDQKVTGKRGMMSCVREGKEGM